MPKIPENNGVPTRDPESNDFFTADQLLSEVRRNLICSDLHIILQPRWLRPQQSIFSANSSISFAFLDPAGSITQAMASDQQG
jgi:hypothetical protein